MDWNSITAIATSLTVLVGLGASAMIWMFTKPKVELLNSSPVGWFYSYKDGKDIDGICIAVNVELVNNGSENTTLTGSFTDSDSKIFLLNNPIKIEGHGERARAILHFELPYNNKFTERKTIHGTLELEPWGNRRLFFGKKYLTRELNITEKQEARII